MRTVRKIMVKPRLEQAKIVMTGETFSWESVSQTSSSWEWAFSRVTYITPMENEGNEGDSLQCMWHSGSLVKVTTGGTKECSCGKEGKD